MQYYCKICNMFIKPKSKSRHFKSNNQKNSDKFNYIKLTINIPNIDNIDNIFYTHINEYDIKYDFYRVRYEIKLYFNNMEDYGVASSLLTGNKTTVSCKLFVENVINNFKNDEFDFSHISQKNILIVCNRMDMTYDFYMKDNMHAVKWKLSAMINKDKNLIKKLPLSWIHPINKKFEFYRV